MSRAGPRTAVSISPGSSHIRRALGALVLAAVIGGWGGLACVTTGEGEKMRADIASLRTKLDEIEKRDKEYKEQVVRLRKVLGEATALLTRNSADVGAKAGDVLRLQPEITAGTCSGMVA